MLPHIKTICQRVVKEFVVKFETFPPEVNLPGKKIKISLKGKHSHRSLKLDHFWRRIIVLEKQLIVKFMQDEPICGKAQVKIS